MGNGTTVKIYKKNLHRTNAKDVLEEAKDTKEHIKKLLISFASMNKSIDIADDREYLLEDFAASIVNAIDGYLEEYADACITELLAYNMVEFPEDCEDDFDEFGDKTNEG
jgi:hypothetical protein